MGVFKIKFQRSDSTTYRGGGGIVLVVFVFMLIPSLYNILMSARTSLDISSSMIPADLFFMPTTTSTTNANASSSVSSILPFSNSSSPNDILEQIQFTRDELVDALPEWVIEFIDWQQQQLQTMTIDNWNWRSDDDQQPKYKFLILRCTKKDKTCGGLSDRIKPILFLIRVAYESKRIFFIRWDRPHPIENFLQPTEHFNWSVPYYIEQKLLEVSSTYRRGGGQPKRDNSIWGYNHESSQLLEDANATGSPILLEVKKQLDDGGRAFFGRLVDPKTTNQTYESIYPGLFRAIFKPSPGVAALVKQQFEILGIQPGQYVVAHYRSFYAKKMDQVPQTELQKFARNAINCASTLSPGDPIFFASDSSYASEAVVEYSKSESLPNIYTNSIIHQHYNTQQNQSSTAIRKDPLHLEYASRGNRTFPVDAFYDVFVDLLVLGNSRCISFGRGGYGVFANMLSFDPLCYNRHTQKGGQMVPCNQFKREA